MKRLNKLADIKQNQLNKEFEENVCNKEIKKMFPNSDINCICNLNISNDDSVGLYGYIDVDDAFRLYNIYFSNHEKMLYKLIYEHIYINNPRKYCYFTDGMIDTSETYIEEEVEELYNEWKEHLDVYVNIQSFCDKSLRLQDYLQYILSDFCKKMNDIGKDIYKKEII